MFKHEKCTNEKIFEGINRARVCGVIEKNFDFSHEIYDEKFFQSSVSVQRLSGVFDNLPVMVSSEIKEQYFGDNAQGKLVGLEGQIRSYNKMGKDGRRHLELVLFVKNVTVYESEEDFNLVKNTNEIYLDGFLCRNPNYRVTPFGRHITDFMLAVNRAHNKTDYLPCITWAYNAEKVAKLEVGERIKLRGRMQSRIFQKVYEDTGKTEWRTINEISVMNFIE